MTLRYEVYHCCLCCKYWMGVKSIIATWNEALKTLRYAYRIKLPPFLIYRELFSSKQNENERTFSQQTRALISRLPNVLIEKVQLDIIYGLLHRHI